MSEIGVSNDNLAPDAEGFPKNVRRSQQFLKCAQQQHVIKRPGGVLVQSIGNVPLMHHQPAFDAPRNQDRVALDALGADLVGFHQPLQERAVAGPQVQHARVGRQPLNHLVIKRRMHGIQSAVFAARESYSWLRKWLNALENSGFWIRNESCP